jgi:formylglycine-generating enzyme required for sulfatase activity
MRALFDGILEGVPGFFRQLNREIRAPSDRVQEWAAIQERLDRMEKEQEIDHQAILEGLSQSLERLQALGQPLARQEIPLWKATLKQLRGLIVVVAGATGRALFEALDQEEVYPEFKAKLEQLRDHVDAVLELYESPAVTPEHALETARAPSSLPATELEPEMVLIPAGQFLMGSDPRKDTNTRENEQPQHTVYLPDYYLAKTPVTNAQYAAFMNATGQSSPYLSEEGEPPRGEGDHPVVDVSWRDAVAYCNWLTEVTGKSYRLPSEAEWEKGARGTDGRIYPWGNGWDANRCNSHEGGPGDTAPVGAYPQRASPYGLLDMAGNVREWWEWCHSLYWSYPYDAGDGREDPHTGGNRVLRGGSFDGYQWSVRCANRGGSDRFSGFGNVGFRVVVAPGF